MRARFLVRLGALCLCVVLSIPAGCRQEAPKAPAAAPDSAAGMVPGTSIYDMLQSDGRFSTFAAAIDSAGIVETFQAPAPLTVFAPTNQAFAAHLDLLQPAARDSLKKVLLLHCIKGVVRTPNDSTGARLTTLQGAAVWARRSGKQALVNGVPVLQGNITAGNGMIHVVGGVVGFRADSTAPPPAAPVPEDE